MVLLLLFVHVPTKPGRTRTPIIVKSSDSIKIECDSDINESMNTTTKNGEKFDRAYIFDMIRQCVGVV